MAEQPIIIKKVVHDDDHGHHGGAWKVAYADFMTAMMAFFLLLWLLGASDEEELRGIADYFAPSVSESGGRGQGVLAGEVIAPDGVLSGADGKHDLDATPTRPNEVPAPPEGGAEPDGAAEDTPEAAPDVAEDDPYGWPFDLPEREAEAARAAAMVAMADRVRARVEAVVDREAVARHVVVERVPEGVRVQIVDDEDRSMFAVGSAALGERPAALIAAVAAALAAEEGRIAVSGHTDSLAFRDDDVYGNWELSTDRANAARRALLRSGFAPERIARVAGLADTVPLEGAAPDAAGNRRIAILLKVDADGAGGLTDG